MTNKPPVKVIIDTNLWISFLIGQALANLKTLMVSQTIQIVLCDQLQEEIRRVTLKVDREHQLKSHPHLV